MRRDQLFIVPSPLFCAVLLVLSSFSIQAKNRTFEHCEHQYLGQAHKLSNVGKEKRNFKQIIRVLLSHDLLGGDNSQILRAFADCWAKYHDNGEKVGPFTVQWKDQQLLLGDSLRLRPRTSKSLAAKLPGILRKFDVSLRPLLWYIWTEAAIAATNDRYNRYVYADEIDQENVRYDGRAYAVGLHPEFKDDKMFVGRISDQNLFDQGLRAGHQIIEIMGSISPREKYSWWLQTAPFRYKIRFLADGVENQVASESVVKLIPSMSYLEWRGLAYIKINRFSGRSDIELSRLLRNVGQGKDGIVIDVRFNGGGRVNPRVIDQFLKPKNLILVYQHLHPRLSPAQPGEIVELFGSVAYVSLPVVVLQNRFSASMSELFAAMLQSQGRATVVGENSHGKAVGQRAIPIGTEGTLYLVDIQYFYPGGTQSWAENGVVPDVQVETTQQELDRLFVKLSDEDIDFESLMEFDTVLSKAVNLLGVTP